MSQLTLHRSLIPVALATAIALLALGLEGCASPPWSGMPESEISAWKGLSVEPERAQEWRRNGFGPDWAGPWLQEGFDPRTAKRWDRELFSAREAAAWRDAAFDLDDAIRHRARGLAPIGIGDTEVGP